MSTHFRSPEMWLDPRSLQSRVGSTTWAKAQQLFLQNRVLALAIEPLTKYGLGRWQVTGKVKGSLARPYEVSCTVYLDNDGELRQWESGELHHAPEVLHHYVPTSHIAAAKSVAMDAPQVSPAVGVVRAA